MPDAWQARHSDRRPALEGPEHDIAAHVARQRTGTAPVVAEARDQLLLVATQPGRQNLPQVGHSAGVAAVRQLAGLRVPREEALQHP